jgi:DNA repair protein RadA/Sms
MLVEVQALVAPSIGLPRRVVTGLDPHRVALVLAVLERHGHVRLQDRDVFVKVTGGVEVEDPAIDLAVAAAVASSLSGQPVDDDWVLMGEVGLTGEIRSAARMADRLREAQQMGLGRALTPVPINVSGIKTVAVNRVAQALTVLGVSAQGAHPDYDISD